MTDESIDVRLARQEERTQAIEAFVSESKVGMRTLSEQRDADLLRHAADHARLHTRIDGVPEIVGVAVEKAVAPLSNLVSGAMTKKEGMAFLMGSKFWLVAAGFVACWLIQKAFEWMHTNPHMVMP